MYMYILSLSFRLMIYSRVFTIGRKIKFETLIVDIGWFVLAIVGDVWDFWCRKQVNQA